MKRLWYYYIYLLVIWGSFRYFVRLPEVIEELWFKPILWLIPLFWWNLSFKENLEMFGRKWISSLGLGVLVGLLYFVLLKGKTLGSVVLNGDILGVALATAVTEELTFSGFIAGYLERIKKGKWTNLLLVGFLTAVIRLPILLFVYQATGIEVLGVVLVAFASGIINAWIRVKTGNVMGSILARLLMNLAVVS